MLDFRLFRLIFDLWLRGLLVYVFFLNFLLLAWLVGADRLNVARIGERTLLHIRCLRLGRGALGVAISLVVALFLFY